MKYATLARAFAHAGVPTIVATLWQVDDETGAQLMEAFYKHLKEGEDVLTALARAQRTLLWKAEKWAGYIPFGKPD